MPLLKHAKKKQRQDKKRTIHNKKLKETYKSLVKAAKEEKTAEAVQKAFSGIDKAAKKQLIHNNKASRMKSALAKLVNGAGKKQEAPEKKATTPKSNLASAKKSAASSPKKSARTATKKKSSIKK